MSKSATGGREPIQALAAMRSKRGQVWARRKVALLRQISATPISSTRILRDYHDLLLFLTAFPDSAAVHRLAQSELLRLAGLVGQSGSAGARLAGSLIDTGIANTDVDYIFTLPITRWLVNNFPDDVDLSTDDELITTLLDGVGHIFLPHIEQDSMLTDRMSTRELFDLSKGEQTATVLAWIIHRYEQFGLSGSMYNEFFDRLNIPLRWQLKTNLSSRTFIRFPQRRTSFADRRAKSEALFEKQIQATLPRPKTLSSSQANRLIDVARATLTVRHRETEAITYPNPDEVTLFQLDGGVDVAIFGMLPEQRLAIESFFGFVAARNAVPVAYGGGFVYLDRLDIGLNIFREYRGGGSGFLFGQILRAYSQHYRAKQIIIDSAQFGYGRAGGIQSGAFWFYYRLGFRHVDGKLAAIAEDEWRKIKRQTGYRTPASVLRRFTGSNLILRPGHDGSPGQFIPVMADIGLAVTRHAAIHHNGDRQAQAQWARRRVKRALGVGDTRSWPGTERQALLRMCPLIALIPDLDDWSERQKSTLVALLRAKGGPKERQYVLMMQRHRRLAAALAKLASGSAQ